MKFALLLGFSHYRDFPALAQAAEAAGFNSVCMPDSLFYPKTTESEYPYNDTKVIREYIEAATFIEPFIAMALQSSRPVLLIANTALVSGLKRIAPSAGASTRQETSGLAW